MLFCFLLFSLLDNFLEMSDVVFLVLDDLLSRLNLSLGSVLISFDLYILSLNFLVFLVEFNKFLILGLDLISKLFHLERHSFVLFLEITDFLLRPEKVFRIQISIRSDCFIKVLLMFAFVFDLLILSLKILNLCIF